MATDDRHPLDKELRARVKAARAVQINFAETIGRKGPWLNKYMNGGGSATVDDVIRMVALLIGLEGHEISATERRLLKAVQKLEEPDRLDLLAYAEHRAKLARRGPSKEPSEQVVRTKPETGRKARGIR